MHELSLCESLLDLIEEQALKDGFDKVLRVRLELGALSCVSAEALEFCFPAVMQGSLAEQASLEIETRPGRAFCPACGAETGIASLDALCPSCGAAGLEVTSGFEMTLKELEVS